MTTGSTEGTEARIQAALAELRERISERYPTASFAVSLGEDPEGVYLTAMVDVEDTDAVVDIFIDRLLATQVEEGLPVYVTPLRSANRVAASLQHPQAIAATASRCPPPLPTFGTLARPLQTASNVAC